MDFGPEKDGRVLFHDGSKVRGVISEGGRHSIRAQLRAQPRVKEKLRWYARRLASRHTRLLICGRRPVTHNIFVEFSAEFFRHSDGSWAAVAVDLVAEANIDRGEEGGVKCRLSCTSSRVAQYLFK